MRWLSVTMVMLLAWGSSTAFANTNPEVEHIKSWMADLNSYYGDLSVMPRRGYSAGQMRRDLQDLQSVLNQQLEVEDGSLISIACLRAACGEDPNGPCHTCAPF